MVFFCCCLFHFVCLLYFFSVPTVESSNKNNLRERRFTLPQFEVTTTTGKVTVAAALATCHISSAARKQSNKCLHPVFFFF